MNPENQQILTQILNNINGQINQRFDGLEQRIDGLGQRLNLGLDNNNVVLMEVLTTLRGNLSINEKNTLFENINNNLGLEENSTKTFKCKR